MVNIAREMFIMNIFHSLLTRIDFFNAYLSISLATCYRQTPLKSVVRKAVCIVYIVAAIYVHNIPNKSLMRFHDGYLDSKATHLVL